MFRVIANFVDDGERSPQIMIFDVALDRDKKITSKRFFGYSTEDDEGADRYPFIIEEKNKKGIVDWGGCCEDRPSNTNIFSKNIKIGEYFTRIDYDEGEEDEYTYVITRVEEIN